MRPKVLRSAIRGTPSWLGRAKRRQHGRESHGGRCVGRVEIRSRSLHGICRHRIRCRVVLYGILLHDVRPEPVRAGFSVPTIAAFAIHVIRNSGWALPVVSLLLCGFAFVYPHLGATRRAWAGACTAALLFTFATAGALRGRTAAREDMLDTSDKSAKRGIPEQVGGIAARLSGQRVHGLQALVAHQIDLLLFPTDIGGGLILGAQSQH